MLYTSDYDDVKYFQERERELNERDLSLQGALAGYLLLRNIKRNGWMID